MQSDTIIGIAGAVVLVAVMVGVFAYEYNNAPDEPGDGGGGTEEQQAKELFNETYETLDPDDDIDWDGTPNWQDDDLDDDGTDNGNDTDIIVDKDFDGTVAQAANDGQASTYEFMIGEGFQGGEVAVTWSVTGPLNVDNLEVSISGPADIPCDSGAGEATCDLASAGPGTYTVEVSHTQAVAAEKEYAGNVNVVY